MKNPRNYTATKPYTKKLASTAISTNVTKLEKMSEKNFFHAICRSMLPQRIAEPIVGTTKQSQFIAINPRAMANEIPFCMLSVMIKTVANAVKSESKSCPAYIFGIIGFALAINACFSASDNLSNPKDRMWMRPIGVLSEYQNVPTTAAIIAPAMASKMMVVMCVGSYLNNKNLQLIIT